MLKIKKNENSLIEIERNLCFEEPVKKPSPLLKKSTTKFSMSNENEFLFNSSRDRKKTTQKKPPQKFPRRNLLETKAKSEEKYTGSPGYQIFMARQGLPNEKKSTNKLGFHITIKGPDTPKKESDFFEQKINKTMESNEKNEWIAMDEKVFEEEHREKDFNEEEEKKHHQENDDDDDDEDKKDNSFSSRGSQKMKESSLMMQGYLSDENNTNIKNVRRNT